MIKNFIFKISLALIFSFIGFVSKAQTEVAIAKNYLNQNADKEKLSTADLARMEVSSAYLSPTTGWYHIYFKQMYASIEVYNGMLNTTIKNGNVAYVASSFVPDLDNSIQQNASLTAQLSSGKTQISPVQALQIAATNVNLKTSLIPEITTQKSTSLVTGLVNKATLQDKNLSNEDIQIKLYWLPYIDSTGLKPQAKVALTYNVQFLTKDGQNKWSTHVDAISGKVLANHDEVIHCDFGKPDHDCAAHAEKPFKIFPAPQTNATTTFAANTYNVFDYPLQAPTFGSRTFVTSPYNRFAPTGTGPDLATNGWHSDGTTAYANTKGNNVDAKDDLANDNEATIGSSPSPEGLDFNYTYSQTTGSAATNLNAAITNLFYWNNVMHDVLWRYGFDEPSGNFQKNNMGRGGVSNDFVFADAQDGGGTNNANFLAPVDGGNGRMQMYIWSDAGSPLYQPDADFDNGIIAHEYGHGWSIRLTGGPANSSCLQNAEQGGEGWSDYIALMTTTNWSSLTPTVASANIPRSIGTYVLGQATTGQGIRPFKYSYDKANINNSVTYAGVGNTAVFSQPHGIGSIWATMLWDMTWEIILQDNQIVNNIYNVPANIADYRGNIAALKLVNEGLRLQPCSPSFVQARDAILQADQMLFAGRYRCAIDKAFARRGLGAQASTGSSTNDRVVTEDFTTLSGPNLSSPFSATACSGSPFVYTATTAASGTFTYTWTRAAVSGISNAASSGTGAIISETLIDTTANDITVQYQITISPNACGVTPPAPQIVNVVVKKNIATLLGSPLFGNVCSGSTFNYTATTAAVGTYTFAWTRAAVPGISNPAGSGSSANISETLINTTQDLIAVQYQFVVSPNACGTTPLTQPVTIVINPSTITPTVVTYSVCQNASVPSGEGLAVSSSVPPVTSFIGTIASGPTYVRGAGDNTTTYTANRAVFYKTYSFIAPATGAVTFATTAAALSSPFPDDTYLTLYQSSFYPASPATNFLRGDDDSGPGYLSSLTQTLTAGTVYIVVVSTYETGATGPFILQASTAVFGQTVNWYLNASGGSPLATGAVFNPVGVPGSGITNTATAGSTTFYVADAVYPGCRSSAVFTVVSTPVANITANGPTTFCPGGSVTLSTVAPVNNALNFVRTSSQYVSVPHSASINLGATFTMEAWVNYSGQNITIIDKGDYDFLWSLNPNTNTNQMGFYTKGTGAWTYSTGIVPQNTWTHVAVSLNAGTLTFYINGIASGTAAVTFSQDDQPMNIGRQQPTFCVCNHFNGTMDELRLWNVVRTPNQILTNMNRTIPINSAGLAAYYKFDEGTGGTTADATSNGNNGTLVNAPTWQVPATSPVNRVLWSPGGATTASIVVTTPGTYTATVTDGTDCPKVGSVVVNLLPKPNLGPDKIIYHNCLGEATNLLNVFNTSGLVQAWNYSPASVAPPGNYQLIATNPALCTDTANVNIILEVATWTGTQSSDWHNPANWNINKVPTAQTHVIVNPGNPYVCTVFNQNAVAASVQVRNSATFLVVNGMNVLVNGKCLTLPPN
jgi:hypothetical protein